jgi:hypothetical protein
MTICPVSYIAGVYYQYGRLRDNLYQGFYFAPLAPPPGGWVPTLTPVAGLVSVNERSDQYSGFAAVTLRPVDRLRVNLAGRYTLVEKNDRRTATMGSGTLAGFHGNYRNLQETATVLVGATSRQVVTNAARSVADGVEVGPCAAADAPADPLRQHHLHAGALRGLSQRAVHDAADRANRRHLHAGSVGRAPRLRAGPGAAMSRSIIAARSRPDFEQSVGTFVDGLYRGRSRDTRMALNDSWEIAIIGRNLTDKLTASYRQVVPSSPGALGALAEPPRSIGLQARFKYR